MKIIITGGAGLVGQNLVARLKAKAYDNLIVLDKHETNINILKKMHNDIHAECVDLSVPGAWMDYFIGADVVVMLHAQIGGNEKEAFIKNNLLATSLVLDAIRQNQTLPYLVHVSSSVVESEANDFYTDTKTAQENMVLQSGLTCPILRPTLMFGWFDRKHLGWLARFMKKIPVFPIPGDGRYMRQPLYAGDFCDVIISCIENKIPSGVFNISGHEKIDYIDMIREIKSATNANSFIIKIPYQLFYSLLYVWGMFDKNPPFTTQQLSALIAKDEFEVIDWPQIFSVKHTSFKEAIHQTFNHPTYSQVVLEF